MTVSLYDSILCRLCSEENTSGAILFDDDSNSGVDLCSMINSYLPIKVEDDGKHPRTICPGCNLQLHATVQFFDLLIQGQKKIRELWKEQVNREKRREKQQQSLLLPKPRMVSSEVSRSDLHSTLGLTQSVSGSFSLENSTGIFESNPSQSILNNSESVQSVAIEDELDLNFDQVDTNNGIYSEEHGLVLRVAGLEKPRKKRGRPRKQAGEQPTSDLLNDPSKSEQDELFDSPKSPSSDSALDGTEDGRRRRKRKIPVRFREAVQGKELERIFKEEGVTDGEEDKDLKLTAEEDDKSRKKAAPIVSNKEVIGHMESLDGQNLGELIIVNKIRMNRNQKRRIKRRKARFHCDVCGRGFLHNGRYLYHKSFHTGIKFECVECKKRFTTKENFELHQKVSGHSGEGIVKECIEPEKEPDDKESESGGKLSCEKCNKSFSTKQNLEIHMKAVHEGEKPFECEICHKRFGYQNSLRSHVLTHHEMTGHQGFPCDICGRRLNHPSSVIYHKEAEHNNGRRFVCERCGKAFKHKQLLHRHQLVHTNARPYQCVTCSASFKTKANLLSHQSTHTGEKRHFCEICGHQFAHKTSLILHYRWHSGQKPYQCHVCQKSFSQKGNLHEHIRIHTGEKPFACDFCEKKFTTSSQFKLHLKRHTGERPWKCEFCGKAFLHKDTWKCHMRRHKGEKPYPCTFCSREFSEQWALKKHMRLHTGERPYTCEVCGKAFADCSNLAKHRKVHDRDVTIDLTEAIITEGAFLTTDNAIEGESAASCNVNGLEYNVWNIVKQVESNESDPTPTDTDEVQQIIYVTYQDPGDPNGKVCEKYLMPGILEDNNELNNDLNLPASNDVQLTTTDLANKSLQFMDEHGNPVQFTLQGGEMQQVPSGLDGGDNLQVLMKDGQAIPIQLTSIAPTNEKLNESFQLQIDPQPAINPNRFEMIKVDRESTVVDANGSKMPSIQGNIPASYGFIIQNSSQKDQLESFGTQISNDYLDIN